VRRPIEQSEDRPNDQPIKKAKKAKLSWGFVESKAFNEFGKSLIFQFLGTLFPKLFEGCGIKFKNTRQFLCYIALWCRNLNKIALWSSIWDFGSQDPGSNPGRAMKIFIN